MLTFLSRRKLDFDINLEINFLYIRNLFILLFIALTV